MKIISDLIAEMTIEQFADANQLVMVVRERKVPVGDPMRFYASFENTEIKGDGVLVGAYGDGATPKDAIRDYAREISLQRLVIHAWRPNRKEVDVPRLVEPAE